MAEVRLIDANAAERYWQEVLRVKHYADDYAKGFQAGLLAVIERPTIAPRKPETDGEERTIRYQPHRADVYKLLQRCRYGCRVLQILRRKDGG